MSEILWVGLILLLIFCAPSCNSDLKCDSVPECMGKRVSQMKQQFEKGLK